MKSLMLAFTGAIILSSFSFEKTAPPPKVINPLHAVHITDAAGLLVDGVLDVSQFVANNGRLWAVCKLKGKIGGLPVDLDCMVPVKVTDCDGGIRVSAQAHANNANMHDCECITIIFEPCVVPSPTGPAITINQEDVPCGIQDFSGDALCCVNRLVGTSGSPIHEICACMNRLL